MTAFLSERRSPRKPAGRGHRRFAALTVVLASLAAPAGCYTSSDGLEPPLDAFYFPTGLAVSAGGSALYVANSNFDLQYNGGTVQAFDLAALRQRSLALRDALLEQGPAGCGSAGLAPNPDEIVVPGPCASFQAGAFLRSSASIGAFASGLELVYEQEGSGARLFVPVRGDPSVTYFDVDDDRAGGGATFRLACGQAGADLRCDAAHRVGQDPGRSLRGLKLPVEPVGIAASEDGRAIVTAHQTAAAVSLVVNRWDEPGAPTLEYFLGGLPEGPTEVATVPVPAFVEAARAAGETVEHQAGFLVTYRNAPQVDLLRLFDDAAASPPRPFLTRAASAAITTNANGRDSRGMAVDGSARAACEASCAGELACLRACLEVPLRFFVANRTPASLLVGEVTTEVAESDLGGEGRPTGVFDRLRIYDAVPLAFGASRVELGTVLDADGRRRARVFAVAFDTRQVFVYDPEARRIEAIIRTGRGPHGLAFDAGEDHALLYVGHFTDSYLGVVDLDARKATYGTMIATLGQPTPPKELQ